MTTLSVTLVDPSLLLGTRASNSSKNKMQGEFLWALSKRSLTPYSLAPIYLFKISGPLITIKFIYNWLAVSYAKKVLPHPGGPYNKAP